MSGTGCTSGDLLCSLAEGASLITAFASVGGIITFIFGIIQYRNHQTWKRNEFLASEIAIFQSQDSVRDTIRMLDWSGRAFVILRNEEYRYIVVTHSSYLAEKIDSEDNITTSTKFSLSGSPMRCFVVSLERALSSSDNVTFTLGEMVIRDIFDEYLYHLERLYSFCENGLFSFDELKPYLEYHARLFEGGPPSPPDFHKCLHDYLAAYGFKRASALFSKFKPLMPAPQAAELSAAKQTG